MTEKENQAVTRWLFIVCGLIMFMVVLGGYVRSFASVKGMAFRHAKEALEGTPPFGSLERMQAVTLDQLHARRADHFVEDAFAAAIIDRTTQP